MRLIHTSDWHLGQTFHDFSRVAEHQAFLDWLIDTVAERSADALLIAGDIFDQNNPSAESQAQFYGFLSRLRQRCPRLDVVVIAGNHDSSGRLEAPIPLLEGLGIHVIGQIDGRQDESERVLVPLHNAEGQVAAWCLAVPFLRPGDVRPDSSSSDPYLSGVGEVYARYVQRACAQRQPGQALIAMGHCHLLGGAQSQDSERRLLIGGAEALRAAIFPAELSYVALGHLHLAQEVDGQTRIRYCGSPIPLSFAELGYPHQVLEVELQGEALTSVNPISVPRRVPMLRVPTQHQPLEAVLHELHALQLKPEPVRDLQAFVEVQVLLDAPLPMLRAQIETALQTQPARLAKISTQRRSLAGEPGVVPTLSLDAPQTDPEQMLAQLHQDRYEGPPSEALLQALRELLLNLGGVR